MALPVGIITGTVTWGELMNYAGIPLTSATVTIGASADITWSATGTALFASNLTATGVTGSMVLPATDQPGFVAGGVPVKDWSYTATIESPGHRDRTIMFQLPTAGQPGVSLDLDTLIPLDDSTPGTVVTVPSIVSVNGQTGPTVTLDAVSVGALPSNAPAVLKNPAATATPLVIRNTTDTANALTVSSGGTVTASGGVTGSGAVTSTVNGIDALVASGTTGGIRFGSTAGQTFIARNTTQLLVTDSYWRVKVSTTAARITASAAGVGTGYFDSTLGKPVWSDGTNWRDAAGTIV